MSEAPEQVGASVGSGSPGNATGTQGQSYADGSENEDVTV